VSRRPNPLLERGLVNLEYSAILKRNGSNFPPRAPVPANEFGIVIPPPVTNCIGEDCRFKNGDKECELNRHHLHSSLPFYESAGHVATTFRQLDVLTVWVHECRHAEHHSLHEIDVEVPSLEVMHECIDEARKIRSVYNSYHTISSITEQLARETSSEQRKRLKRARERLLNDRKDIVAKTESIEVIPEVLVTGALLFAASNYGQSRIVMGSDYVFTGTMRKKDITVAVANADEALAKKVA